MERVITTEKYPIKLWLNDIEPGALQQAKNIANLPFIHKWVSIMPDSHQGYGMPIGGVMATIGVVVPNAVGVDIGCVDKDTEYLSPKGWKQISKYDGGLVMQFNLDDNTGKFTKPLSYIKESCDKFYHIKTKYGIDQKLSDEHRCLVYKYDRSYNFNKCKIIHAEELYTNHKKLKNGFGDKFLTSFTSSPTTNIDITDAELRVMVMVCADGNLSRNLCRLGFKKERKYDRAIYLLNNCGIKFNDNSKSDNYRISFKPPIHKKGLHQFWEASQYQLQIISDEVIYWDGNDKDQVFFTRIKEEADFINYVFSGTGYRSSIQIDKRESGTDYRVFKMSNTKIGINGTPKTPIKIVKSEDGYKYCFTVPSSYLILRRNGNVFVTGNCGMCAVKTNMKAIEIEDVKKVMSAIRERIPVGFKHHSEKQGWSGFDNAPVHIPIIKQQIEAAKKQLGTLGGGNHFIEIQKGSDGHIWFMIHSGSRNFGLKIAQEYNKKAQELCERWHVDLPDKELAFLPMAGEVAKEYMEAMNFALSFAAENRRHMKKAIIKCLSENVKDFNGIEDINIHHNYAAWENHYGKNVIIHRKGATSARAGQLGIIPGSQGTKSYIVKGLGDPESFKSCSHGAGRRMGRKQAQRELNLKDQQEILNKQGVVHGIRNEKDLDEAPGAYKDIDVVMENQKDLVEIVTELIPIAVIKG